MSARRVVDSLGSCHNSLTPIPFDRQLCPTDNDFLSNLTDDQIMSMPPHVAVHAMRTAAQNGAQVVSPRQVPSSYMLGRTKLDASQPFLHAAACESQNSYQWPVPDGHAPISRFQTEDRVVTKRGMPLARRSPARSTPVTYATSDISNPIHKAALKIKANIDFQNREDVRGDPEELAKGYARVWGQPDDFFGSLSTVTLAHLADLRSHAISPDTAFARFLGPIHDRRVVSVAVSPSSTVAFGDDFAVDWTCMRVSAEAKYIMTAGSEGYSLRELAISAPIGTYPSGSRPACAIVFHPNPGVAWCHGSLTFQIRCTGNISREPVAALIAQELEYKAKTARAGDILRLYDAAVRWTLTQSTGVSVTSNALASSVSFMASATSKVLSIGRSAQASVREVLMESLKSAPVNARRTLARSISALRGILNVLADEDNDRSAMLYCCEYLAKRFQTLDGSINAKMLQVAISRRKNYEDWYATIKGQSPDEFKHISMGSYGWTVLSMYFLFVPPDKKWSNYAKSIQSVGIMAMQDVRTPLPSISPDDDPTLRDLLGLRCDTVARSKADMYGSSYLGVAKACYVLSAAWDNQDDGELADLMKIAGILWVFRARCAESVRVIIAEEGTEVPNNAVHLDTNLGPKLGNRRVIATIAPYTHYVALVKGLKNIGFLANEEIPERMIGKISDHVARWEPLIDDVDATLSLLSYEAQAELLSSQMIRYVNNLAYLAYDIEMFLVYAVNDANDGALDALRNLDLNARTRMADIAERQVAEEAALETDTPERTEPEIDIIEDAAPAFVAPSEDALGWDLVEILEETVAEDLMMAYDNEDEAAIVIMDSTYKKPEDFVMAVSERYKADRKASKVANALN